MTERKAENHASEDSTPFRKSFTTRYSQWKRTDLLAVALETMPKHIDPDKVLDNLIKLRRERDLRLFSEET